MTALGQRVDNYVAVSALTWDDSAWVVRPVKVWDGGAWAPATV